MQVVTFLLLLIGQIFFILAEYNEDNLNEDHEIRHLPNLIKKDLSFRHYAGFLKLDSGEKLFYWYAEAQNNPETAPLAMWLNGGPGCSSLGGFFTENGPFVVDGELNVHLNRYSWNRHVNLIWLESPAGVGFSKPFRHHPYDDDYTASRNYEFIKKFFSKYSSLKNRDFYLVGESYAGHYIPTLTDLLVRSNNKHINFKGFAVGNPTTDSFIDSNAYLDYYYSHGLVSLEKYKQVKKICGLDVTCFFFEGECSKECSDVLDDAIEESEEEKFNEYFIYGDRCLLPNKQGGMLKSRRHQARRKPKTEKILRRGKIGPCADAFTEKYLNLPQVQKSIHAIDSNSEVITWKDCNDDILEIYNRTPSMLPLYKSFLGKGLKVLVYSGDADSVVNFMGTERCIAEGLQLKVKSEWEAWFAPDHQIAGYKQEYESGLSFVTVKGAGHMVPATRPLRGLVLFECYIFKHCDKFTYPTDPFEEIAQGEEGIVLSTISVERVTFHSILLVTFATIAVICFIAVKRYLPISKGYVPLN